MSSQKLAVEVATAGVQMIPEITVTTESISDPGSGYNQCVEAPKAADGGPMTPESSHTSRNISDTSSYEQKALARDSAAATDGGPMTPMTSVTVHTSENVSDTGSSYNKTGHALLAQDPAVMATGTDGGLMTPDASAISENISDTGSNSNGRVQAPAVVAASKDISCPTMPKITPTLEGICDTGSNYKQTMQTLLALEPSAVTDTDSGQEIQVNITMRSNMRSHAFIREKNRMQKKSRLTGRIFERNSRDKTGRNHAEEEIELLSDTTLPWSTTDYESLSSTTLISSDQDADLSPSLARREDNREQDIVVQDPQHDEDSQDDANDERVGREVGAFAVQSFIYYKCSASRKQWVACRITYAVIISFLLLLMATALGLGFYCVDEVMELANKSGDTINMSTSGVYDLNEKGSYKKMPLYASKVCIHRVNGGLENVTVYLESGSCMGSNVATVRRERTIKHSPFKEEARNLNFYWLKDTRIGFNLIVGSAEPGNFTIYVFQYDCNDPYNVCTDGEPPDNERVSAMLTFTYSEDTHNGTEHIPTSFLSHIVINKTGRYHLCVISEHTNHTNLSYELHIDEVHYTPNTFKFDSKMYDCQPDKCYCMHFKGILREVLNPTSMCIRTTDSEESDNEYHPCVAFNITTQKNWDSVILSFIMFIILTLALASVVSLCSYTCYRKRHPDGYCFKLILVNEVVTCVC